MRPRITFVDRIATAVTGRLAAFMSRAFAPALADIVAQNRAIELTLHRLVRIMSEVTDVLDELNAATNAVAEKQAADTALIEQIKAQLADALSANPQLAADLDAALSGMRATTATLRDLAATPETPVPPSDPIVGDNGDTTAGEPGQEPPA